MTLTDLRAEWQDTEAFHKTIHEHFTDLVNADPKLDAHRTYVESRVFGMGERSFWWLWKLICESLPESHKLLEVGVFKAATLSLWKLLRPDASVYGVTPLDGRGTGWREDDYFSHITKIHQDFSLDMPTLYIGGSEEDRMIDAAAQTSPYDIIYVDGDHSEGGALADLNNYAPMVKPGGYLVIDDCCCDFHMPWGYFQGIQSVQDAFDKWDKSGFEFVCNIVHLRVLKRK